MGDFPIPAPPLYSVMAQISQTRHIRVVCVIVASCSHAHDQRSSTPAALVMIMHESYMARGGIATSSVTPVARDASPWPSRTRVSWLRACLAKSGLKSAGKRVRVPWLRPHLSSHRRASVELP